MAQAGQPVEHLPPKRMTFWYARVVEVVRGIMQHAQLRHDPPGFVVVGDRVCNDLRQLTRIETKPYCGCGGLWRVAKAPEGSRNSPAGFDRRREVGCVANAD